MHKEHMHMSYQLTQAEIVKIVTQVATDAVNNALGLLLPPEGAPQPQKAQAAPPVVTVPERMAAKDESQPIKAERKLTPALGAITFGTLTVEAPEFDPAKLDTQAAAKERSPYNKLRFRVEGAAPLSNEVTFRDLLTEHERLAALVAAKPAKAEKAEPKVIVTPAAVTEPTRKRDASGRFIAAVVEPDAKAARVQVIVDALGVTPEVAAFIVENSDA